MFCSNTYKDASTAQPSSPASVDDSGQVQQHGEGNGQHQAVENQAGNENEASVKDLPSV